MLKFLGKGLLFVVIAAGALFSAVNTFTLFQSIFGDDLRGLMTSAAGLALFDVGALGWLVFYSHSAKGFAQRAVAGAAAAACLLLTFGAASVEVLLTQSLIEKPDWAGMAAIAAILLGLFVNIAGAALVHVLDPKTLKDMAEQSARDAREEQVRQHKERIEREAFRMADDLVNQNAAWLAAHLGEGLKTETIRELLGAHTASQPAPVTVIEPPVGAPLTAEAGEAIPAPAGLFAGAGPASAPAEPAPKAPPRRKTG